MVDLNAVLTSLNALERLSQKNVYFNLFKWHSNMVLKWRYNGILKE